MPFDSLNTDQFTDLLGAKNNIPTDIVKYISYCINKKKSNRLLNELILDADVTAEGLDQFFGNASRITGLSHAEILNATGFSWRDIDPSRIESAIAQLRAIFFLNTQQFADITLILTQESRSSDIVAIRNGRKFAIEVINSIYDANQRFLSHELADWAFSRLTSEGKKAQILRTSEEHSCEKGAYIAVISTQQAASLQTHEDFLEAARLTWEYISSPTDLHICMVTGRVTLGYGSDDAIYPSWPS